MDANKLELKKRLLERPPKNGRYYTLAVDGRGGSGKTVLASYLGRLLPEFIIINGDDYFEPLENQLSWGDFNEVRFAADVVSPIGEGRPTFVLQAYSFAKGQLEPARIQEISTGVIIERCLSIAFPIDWDLIIWVDTSREICLARGIARDLLPRDRVVAVWEQIWQPREDRYIADVQPASRADVLLDGTLPFDRQVT